MAMMQTGEVCWALIGGLNDGIGTRRGVPGPDGLPLAARMAYDAATQKPSKKTS